MSDRSDYLRVLASLYADLAAAEGRLGLNPQQNAPALDSLRMTRAAVDGLARHLSTGWGDLRAAEEIEQLQGACARLQELRFALEETPIHRIGTTGDVERTVGAIRSSVIDVRAKAGLSGLDPTDFLVALGLPGKDPTEF